MRPASPPSPAALNTVVATSGATPQTSALLTMWKIGPECAAQQAKYVSATATNCGVRSACPTLSAATAVGRRLGVVPLGARPA